MLNEGRSEEKGRERRKSGSQSLICVCPFHIITMTSSFSSSKGLGLPTDRWADRGPPLSD